MINKPIVWILLAVAGWFIFRYFRQRNVVQSGVVNPPAASTSINIGQIGGVAQGFPEGPVVPGDAFAT